MDERGFSWPEAMLTLAIILVIFGTLLPLATTMSSSLAGKRSAVFVSETAYHAAITYRASGQREGSRMHEGEIYRWQIQEDEICIINDNVPPAKPTCLAF